MAGWAVVGQCSVLTRPTSASTILKSNSPQGSGYVRQAEILTLTRRARSALDEADKCEEEAAQVGPNDPRQQELLATARAYRLTADELADVALEFAEQ